MKEKEAKQPHTAECIAQTGQQNVINNKCKNHFINSNSNNRTK